MMSTRRIIETVIGQLAERFNIEKVRARDIFHLTGRLYRKLLAHTICCLMNFKRSNPTLQFELLFEQ
jgi:phage shock protein PspC (stress-responsive transcriptional regulator)